MTCENCTCETQNGHSDDYEMGFNNALDLVQTMANFVLNDYENKFMLPQADTCHKLIKMIEKLKHAQQELSKGALYVNE